MARAFCARQRGKAILLTVIVCKFQDGCAEEYSSPQLLSVLARMGHGDLIGQGGRKQIQSGEANISQENLIDIYK